MGVDARVVVAPQAAGSELEVHDVHLRDPGPHEVLVRQFASGICHSQLHTIHNPRGGAMTLGHESTGEVMAVGSAVSGLAPGDTVMVTWVPKDQANARRAGEPMIIDTKDGTAMTRSVFTWATHTLADEMFVVKVPAGIPVEATAIIGCAVITGAGAVLHTAGVQPGESVAIFGVGGVGLSAVAAAKMCGADPIIAVDLQDDKLDFAKRFGATHGVNASSGDAVEQIRALTQSDVELDIMRQPVAGVDYAFDCIGAAITMTQIAEATRGGEFGQSKGGTAVLVGVPQTPIELNSMHMFIGERAFITSLGGSCTPAEDFPRFLDWHANGDLDLDALVTQRYGIDQINEAVHDLEQGRITGRSILVFD